MKCGRSVAIECKYGSDGNEICQAPYETYFECVYAKEFNTIEIIKNIRKELTCDPCLTKASELKRSLHKLSKEIYAKKFSYEEYFLFLNSNSNYYEISFDTNQPCYMQLKLIGRIFYGDSLEQILDKILEDQ